LKVEDHILGLVSTPKYVLGGVFLMLYSSLRIWLETQNFG